jgi:hypothetical protein
MAEFDVKPFTRWDVDRVEYRAEDVGVSADTPVEPDDAGAATALESPDVREALVVATSILDDEEIGRLWRLAKSLHESRMFKGAEDEQITAEQAFAKILIGRDLGLSAARSLMVLHIVRGNVQVAGKQLLAWVRASEQYDYEVVERSPVRGAIQFYERSKRTGEWQKVGPRETPESEPGPITFTIEEAQAAGIVRLGSAWQKWPANMILWRCASIGVNLLCPDLTGGTPIYTEADSFEERPRLGSGEGDGSEPGWVGVSSTQVRALESMIESAREKGHAGLSDRATLQMRIAGQTPAFVDKQLAVWGRELAEFEPVPDADVVEPEPEPDSGLPNEPYRALPGVGGQGDECRLRRGRAAWLWLGTGYAEASSISGRRLRPSSNN